MARKAVKRILVALALVAALCLLCVIGRAVFLARLPGAAKDALERAFPASAEIGSVRFQWPGTLLLENVVLRRRADSSEAVTARRIEVRIGLVDLVAGPRRPDAVLIDGLTLALRDADRDLFRDGTGGELPDFPVRIRDITLTLSRAPDAPGPKTVELRGGAVVLQPLAPGLLSLVAAADNEPLGRVRVTGTLGGSTLDSSLSLSLPRVTLSKQVRALLPPDAADAWDAVDPLGDVALSVDLTWPAGRADQLDLRWRASTVGARLVVKRLATPITDVTLAAAGRGREFSVQELSGSWRSASASLSARSVAAANSLGIGVRGTIRDLEPSKELIDLLPERLRTPIERLHLTGGTLDAEVELLLHVNGGPGKPDATADLRRAVLRLRNCSAKPDQFPYALSGISGDITVADGQVAVTSPIVARHGPAAVTISGALRTPERGGSHLLIEAQRVPLDTDLDVAIAALDPEIKDAWARYALHGGAADGALVLDGLDLDAGKVRDWSLRLALDGCSGAYRTIPYALTGLTGAVELTPDRLSVRNLTARHGAGILKVDGAVQTGKPAQSQLVIRAEGLAVDADLDAAVAALGDKVKDAWAPYGLRGGKINATLALTDLDSAAGKAGDWSLHLALDGCSGSYRFFPYALNSVTGEVDADPRRVSLKDIAAWHGDASVRISGWVDARPDSQDQSVEIRAVRVALDDDLARALSKEGRSAWDSVHPAGLADIDVLLSRPERPDSGSSADVVVRATLRDCSARLPVGAKSVPVEGIAGRVDILGDSVRLTGLSARFLGGQGTVDATLVHTGGLKMWRADLVGDRFSVAELIRFLPDDAAQTVRNLDLDGRLAIRKLSVDLLQRTGEKPDVQYSLAADLRDLALSIPTSSDEGDKPATGRIRLSDINGRIDFASERGRVGVGSFALDTIHMPYGLMRNVTGSVRTTGPTFAVENIRGDLYGGQVEASFSGAKDLLFFNGQVRVAAVDVGRICRETGLTAEHVWGELRAAGHIHAERVQQPGKPASWRLGGAGAIRIDRANLGSTPLVRSLFSIKTFFGGDSSRIEAANVDFEVTSKRLIIDRAILKGPSASTRGNGSLEYGRDPKIDLYFYRKREGGLLPNLPLIDLVDKALNWTLEQIQNSVVIVHVTGTLKDPKVSEPLFSSLTDQFRRFIVFSVWEEESADKAPGADAEE